MDILLVKFECVADIGSVWYVEGDENISISCVWVLEDTSHNFVLVDIEVLDIEENGFVGFNVIGLLDSDYA